jgi:hypothetical protein
MIAFTNVTTLISKLSLSSFCGSLLLLIRPADEIYNGKLHLTDIATETGSSTKLMTQDKTALLLDK